MLRTVLLVLALIILIAIGLFYTGVLSWGGGSQPVQVNPVEIRTETRQVNVQVPVVSTGAPAPAAAPAPVNAQ